jgi:hypothetical protein
MMKRRTLLTPGTAAFVATHVARSQGAKTLIFRLKHALPLLPGYPGQSRCHRVRDDAGAADQHRSL